jgi:uncharacterized membrane protein
MLMASEKAIILYFVLTFLVIPIFTIAIPFLSQLTYHDPTTIFFITFGTYFFAYFFTGILKKTVGKPAFKNLRRSIVLMVGKAGIYALALVMLITFYATGSSQLFTTIKGVHYTNNDILLTYVITYAIVYAILVAFTHWTIRGE